MHYQNEIYWTFRLFSIWTVAIRWIICIIWLLKRQVIVEKNVNVQINDSGFLELNTFGFDLIPDPLWKMKIFLSEDIIYTVLRILKIEIYSAVFFKYWRYSYLNYKHTPRGCRLMHIHIIALCDNVIFFFYINRSKNHKSSLFKQC